MYYYGFRIFIVAQKHKFCVKISTFSVRGSSVNRGEEFIIVPWRGSGGQTQAILLQADVVYLYLQQMLVLRATIFVATVLPSAV